MVRKILIVISVLILLGYLGFSQYKLINSSKELNSLTKEKVKLNGNYGAVYKEVDNLQKNIDETVKEKAETTAKITEIQESLNKVNSDISNRQAEISKAKKARAKQNIESGNGSKVAYLTFDDGPSSNTDDILDILKEFGVKATYFVNGSSNSDMLRLYKRIVDEGHTIGNHVYSHDYSKIYTSIGDFDYYFDKLQDLIRVTTGITMDVMRFPGGSNNTVSNHYNYGIMDVLTVHMKELGYTYYDWNSSAGDTATSGVTNSYVINNVESGCRNKSSCIILMHDTKNTTKNTLATIITDLSNMGFKFLPITSSTHAIQFK